MNSRVRSAAHIFEDAQTRAHDIYLKAHIKDHPFPVDGSNWARLVGMRLHGFAEHRKDFLTALHSTGSLLVREHTMQPYCLNYWFLNPDLHYPTKIWATEDSCAPDDVWARLARHTNMPQALEEAEKRWLHEPCKTLSQPPEKFWLEDLSEMWEPRPLKKRLAIAQTVGVHQWPARIQKPGYIGQIERANGKAYSRQEDLQEAEKFLRDLDESGLDNDIQKDFGDLWPTPGDTAVAPVVRLEEFDERAIFPEKPTYTPPLIIEETVAAQLQEAHSEEAQKEKADSEEAHSEEAEKEKASVVV